MKKLIPFSFLVFTVLLSCEKPPNPVDPNVFFTSKSGLEFKFEDFQFYDSSTHIFYLKKSYPEFAGFIEGPFAFLDKGDTIYKGSFVPAYQNSIPSGPIITSPLTMYGGYAIRIDIWIDNEPDVRNCTRIIEILKYHDLLHSGLTGVIDTVEIKSDSLTFKFTIINKDQSDLLILDMNKTGLNLFHYFTNGLYIKDFNHYNVFESNIISQQPDPWNSYKTDWLTQLKSGDSLTFIIKYSMDKLIDPGDYDMVFIFPGLMYQVQKDQLFQDNNRIWLGDITLRKKLKIN